MINDSFVYSMASIYLTFGYLNVLFYQYVMISLMFLQNEHSVIGMKKNLKKLWIIEAVLYNI